jgi:hypothetical protein
MPRGIVHALWNSTDVDAILLEFISPAGFEGFFKRWVASRKGGAPRQLPRSALGTG